MEIKETVQKLLQEMVVPDLSKIRDENSKILAILDLTNKRLDDVNIHMADQSRRIDDTNKRIDDLRAELTKRIDEVRIDLTQRIEDVRAELTQRIDETNKRIDNLRAEMTMMMDKMHSDLIARLDANNERIDRFFLTASTKDEHEKIDKRVSRLEKEVEDLSRRLAA